MERERRSRTELHRRGTAAGGRGGGARIVPGPVAGTSDEVSHRAGPGGRLPSPRRSELERWRLRSLDGEAAFPHGRWTLRGWAGGWSSSDGQALARWSLRQRHGGKVPSLTDVDHERVWTSLEDRRPAHGRRLHGGHPGLAGWRVPLAMR